ncbi:MAG: protein translocase SEC61 complex subunit gamma [Candidatus Hydrothermarchaeales archaeon]
MEIKDLSSVLKDTFKSWDRVIKLSRKPRRGEFVTITKITGLGTIVVGVIGFTIRMVVQLINRLT